jgi:hypothetical protein
MRGHRFILYGGLSRALKAGKQVCHAFLFFEMNDIRTTPGLLQQPINELPVTEVFKLRSKLMGFYTLNEVLLNTQAELRNKEDFNEHWYYELHHLLNRNGLVHLLDQ